MVLQVRRFFPFLHPLTGSSETSAVSYETCDEASVSAWAAALGGLLLRKQRGVKVETEPWLS